MLLVPPNLRGHAEEPCWFSLFWILHNFQRGDSCIFSISLLKNAYLRKLFAIHPLVLEM